MNRRIAVVGSSNVDFIMKVPSLPRRGETVTDGEFLQTFGGKGANQAVAAARAGGAVTFVTCLGQDLYGSLIVESLGRDGIDTARIRRVDDCSTGAALVMFDAQGENYLTVAPGANYQLTSSWVGECEDLIAASRMLLLQMEIPVESNCELLAMAERHGTPVLFNYAPVRGVPLCVTSAMTGLVVNEIEAGAILQQPISSPEDAMVAAAALRGRGPKFVVVTLGGAGAVVMDGDGARHLGAFAVSPLDTTAAGDTFCGALAVAMVEGHTLAEAVRFANAASALAVTRMGAQPSIPHRREIDAFVQARRD